MSMVSIRPSPQKGCDSQLQHNQIRPVTQPRPILAAGGRCSGGTAGRRSSFSSYINTNTVVGSAAPVTVLRRNARERNRVKQVNHGFAALRNHVPGAAKNKKMSKVETLRRAVEYIQALQEVLRDADGDQEFADQSSPDTKPVAIDMETGSAEGAGRCYHSPSMSMATCCDSLTPTSVCSVDSGCRDTSPMPAFYLNNLEPTSANVSRSPLPSRPSSLSPGHQLVYSSTAVNGTIEPTSNGSCSVPPLTFTSPHQNTPQLVRHTPNSTLSHQHPHHHQQFNIPHQFQHRQQTVSALTSPTSLASPGSAFSSALMSPYAGSTGAVSPTPSYGSAADMAVAPATTASFDSIGFGEEAASDVLSPQDEELLDAIAWWQSSQ